MVRRQVKKSGNLTTPIAEKQDGTIDPTTPFLVRKVESIADLEFVTLLYEPITTNKSQHRLRGVVESVSVKESEGRVRIVFRDEIDDRSVAIILGTTVGESTIRDTDNNIQLGNPLRVQAVTDMNEVTEGGFIKGEFGVQFEAAETTIGAAAIRLNRGAIENNRWPSHLG